MNNILAVIAHPDDLELMSGGSIIKWIKEKKNVYVLTFTDGGLTLPDGTVYRSKSDARNEEKAVSEFIGYSYDNLGLTNLYLQFTDDYVVEVIERIKKYKIDTIICPFEKDLNHDHEVTARIAIAASRRVPNLLMGQVNYFLRSFFSPNIFIDITETWEKKIEALSLYKSQWRDDWFEFLDVTSRYYGKIIGVERAEAFYSPKLKI